jgi:hypothetical protein
LSLKQPILSCANICRGLASTRQTCQHLPSTFVRTRQTRQHLPKLLPSTRQTHQHLPSHLPSARQTRQHSPKAIFEKNVTSLANNWDSLTLLKSLFEQHVSTLNWVLLRYQCCQNWNAKLSPKCSKKKIIVIALKCSPKVANSNLTMI